MGAASDRAIHDGVVGRDGDAQPQGAPGGLTLRRQRSLFIVAMLAPTVTFLLLLTIFPTVYGIGVSLYHDDLTDPLSTHFVGLRNYSLILQDADFWHSALVSATFMLGAVGVELLAGTGIALLLYALPGAQIFRPIFILPMAVTPVAATFTWRIMYDPTLGVLNYFATSLGFRPQAWLADPNLALVSLITVDAWQWTPLVLLILYAGLLSLPHDVLESARVDGASGWSLFWQIMVPLLEPFIFLTLLFRGIDAFKTFDIVYVLTGGGPGDATRTLNLFAFREAFENLNMGAAAAMALLILLILLIASQLLLRRSRLLRYEL